MTTSQPCSASPTGLKGIAGVVGFVDRQADIYNAAAVVANGEVAGVYHKQFLPNYGVFDERRYFQEGDGAKLFTIAGAKVGVTICEDLWYAEGATQALGLAGADVVINISGSPYHHGKRGFRHRMFSTRASDNAVYVAHVNLIGGQDELVFDGNSMVFDAEGALLADAPAFEEHLLTLDLDLEALYLARLHVPMRRYHHLASFERPVEHIHVSDEPKEAKPEIAPPVIDILPEEAEIYRALVTGTRDYVHKNGFETVLVGVSGGIDSSLVAAIATDALGPEHVVAVSNPSRYSSEGSIADARALTDNLGVRLMIIPIEDAHAAYLDILNEAFDGTEPGTAEENIQSRIRGNIWMALSNKFGWQPVLTCGNKSEMATGYATLYGDMAGGFAVIKDVPKTLVYRLAALPQQHRRPRHHPGGCAHEAPVRRAPPRAARHRLPPRLRRPRPHTRGLRGRRPQYRGDCRHGLRRTARAPRGRPGRPQRVQATPGPSRRQDHHPRLRPRPPPAHHQPLPKLGHRVTAEACRRRRSWPPDRCPMQVP